MVDGAVRIGEDYIAKAGSTQPASLLGTALAPAGRFLARDQPQIAADLLAITKPIRNSQNQHKDEFSVVSSRRAA